MINKGKPLKLSASDFIEDISEEAIVEYFFGVFKIPQTICSPLRMDNHPSFRFFYGFDNHIFYKDFSTGESGSLIELLMKFLRCSSMKQLKEKLTGGFTEFRKHHNNPCIHHKGSPRVSPDLNVQVRKWEKHDLDYWGSYGISLKWLEFGRVFPVKYIYIGTARFVADKYAYVFVEFKDGRTTLKVYQPYSKEYKWRNNHNNSVWSLWDQAIKTPSDSLIITSSLKDALCIWENLGIPSVALQSETTHPKKHVIEQIRRKNTYILYDNDYTNPRINTGREQGKILADLFNLKQIEIPEFYQSKDSSDLYHNHGKDVFIRVLESLIN